MLHAMSFTDFLAKVSELGLSAGNNFIGGQRFFFGGQGDPYVAGV